MAAHTPTGIRGLRSSGFTLMELMVVVAIVGILAAVAVPSFQKYQWRARRSEAYANLAGLAKTQQTYYAQFDTYPTVGPAEPGATLGDVPGEIARSGDAIATAFGDVGFAPEGQVRYDYDTNGPLGCGCQECFTASAYGDVDGDGGMGAVMFVHPQPDGTACPSGMFGYGTPVNADGAPMYDTVAVSRDINADDF